MNTPTINQESGLGLREFIEHLYEERQASHKREAVLLRLLEQDCEALISLSCTGRPRPSTARPPSEPLPLHKQFLEALASQPAGLTHAQIEGALETTQPLGGVLDGLCRRKRLSWLGKGGFALSGHNETDRPAKEIAYYGQTEGQ
jgi:hypothetical protein